MVTHTFERMLSVEDVADILGVGREAIYRKLRAGTIRGARLGQRWKVKESDMKAFLEGKFEQQEKQAA